MTTQCHILNVAVPAPLSRLFDYRAPSARAAAQAIGCRVNIPFGRRQLVGVVMGVSHQTQQDETALKSAESYLDPSPILPITLQKLCQIASDYYHHPLGEVIETALPRLLRQGKPATLTESALDTVMKKISRETTSPLSLNAEQQHALKKISEALTNFRPFLLAGVTGSGKTEVYLQAIEAVLKNGAQALVLVPEIGLTPQTLQRFQNRFQHPIVHLHSRLTDRERLNHWLLAKNGEACIVIGTRSAIFTPFKNLGLIIVDESHDLSYKQQEGFRYSARDLALVRGKLESCPVVLGSATPSLESYYNAQQQRYDILSLSKRASGALPPTLSLIDCRGERLHGGLSQPLLAKMKTHLAQQHQVMLLLNRRGFAPTLLCYGCGWIAQCQHCDSRLVVHQQTNRLRCHHCGAATPLITQCPACQSLALNPVGHGTERLEVELSTHFPTTPILRIDHDTTRKKQALKSFLDQIQSGTPQILVGTQMLAKGHHFPNVTLVAVINADGGLFSADFRATERMAQLITQVAGRAGRENHSGEVFIQTHQPDHPLLQQLSHCHYDRVAETLLAERVLCQLPPYQHLALFRADSPQLEKAIQFLTALKARAQSDTNAQAITLCGPFPAPMVRCANRFRAQLLLQTAHRQQRQALLGCLCRDIETFKLARSLRWSLDVDPQILF